MSDQAIRRVIGQAIGDVEYRDLLFSNPDKAVEGLDLTPEELQFVKNFRRDKFEAATSEMEERISRAGALHLKSFAAYCNCF
ncbi:MAG TPA: Os1348 family NHLP clan protein [Syntrophorhabdales bacterium]|nr:Os1348 family NHLP clan protein [Syntrophorhabdales bacterium]